MMVDRDTIIAIATPLGNSLKGIIRLSGPAALRLIRSSFSPQLVAKQYAIKGKAVEGNLNLNDVAIPAALYLMKLPHSYTRDDVVEVHTIGAQVLLQMIVEYFIGKGARLAQPGEFTKRAFLNGRLSLSEAEAVLDVIKSRSDREFRLAQSHLKGYFTGRIRMIKQDLLDLISRIELALDFSDQDIEVITDVQVRDILKRAEKGINNIISNQADEQIHKEGVVCVLCGRVNVGKSSLFNRLVPDRRNIVSPIAGTTRDYIEGTLDYGNKRFRIFDTAGIMKNTGPEVIRTSLRLRKLSTEAQRRTSQLSKDADIYLMVIDGHQGIARGDRNIISELNRQKMILVINKSDLSIVRKHTPAGIVSVKTSARTGDGITGLKRAMNKFAGTTDRSSNDMSINTRHQECLKRALASVRRALSAMGRAADNSSAVSDKGALQPTIPGSHSLPLKLPEYKYELISVDLRDALSALGEIVGETVTDDILNNIFSRFCIGK